MPLLTSHSIQVAYPCAMQHRIFIGALVACTWFAACETGAPSPPPGVQPDARKGFQIALVSCGQCHAFNPESVPQVAPRWHEIAEAYRGERDALAAFLDDPAARGPRMASAVERFGPMPDMGLDRQQALHIAAFVAEADFAPERWWPEGIKQWEGEPQAMNALERAGQIARATKGVLGSQLLAALAEGGPAHAVPFCNERAIPLTDSMSVALNARVRRVSDRPRNPENAATGSALAYLTAGHQRLAAGEPLEPALATANGQHTAFIPITTNGMCLACHGTPDPATQALLAEHYPDDQATGYAENQLRGAWIVEFDAD